MPRWMLDGRKVLFGPYHTAEEHEEHVSQTIGSMEWLLSEGVFGEKIASHDE